MSWKARLGVVMIFVLVALALLQSPPAARQAGENFKDDWPAPDEESIEYLKGIDLRTLQPREGMPVAERVDLYGEPLPSGATVRLCYNLGVSRLAVSADGKRIATGGPPCGPRQVEIFDAATGRCIRRLGSFRGIIESLAFSPDGSRLAVARSDLGGSRDLAGDITLYDLETFEELLRFGAGTGPRTLTFTPDGRYLASGGGDGILWLWDPETGQPDRPFADVTRKIVALAFSADGRRLASASTDEIIRVWDVPSGSVLQQILQPATALTFSPDGRHLASQRSVWDLAEGKELPRFQLPDGGTGIAFSPDGRTVATISDKRIQLHELGSGQVRRGFNPSDGISSFRRAVAFAPDGRSLITGEQWGDALIWNVTGFDGPPARPSDIEALLADLADSQASRAYSAVWGLVFAGDGAVPLLEQRLKQPPPGPVEPARLKRLIANLDDRDFQVRERATQELEHLGAEAEKALRELLADRPPLEVRIRAEQILARIVERGGRLPQEMFRLRGVEVLECLATPAARQALTELARHERDPVLQEDAQRSLERLQRRLK